MLPVPQLVAPLAINGKVYTCLQDAQADLQLPSAKIVKLNSYAGVGGLVASGAPGMPKALWVGTAGTATMKDGYGDVMNNFPLQVGYNPIMISELTALAGASNVWGMY